MHYARQDPLKAHQAIESPSNRPSTIISESKCIKPHMS